MSPSSQSSSGSDFGNFLEQELENAAEEEEDKLPSGEECSTETRGMGDPIPEPLPKRRKLGHPDQAVALKECPPHPGSIHGMCIRCGQPVESSGQGNVALKYIHAGLQISNDEAERVRQAGLRQVRGKRKLLLVLDLDHTLLNSTRFSEVSALQEAKLNDMLAAQEGKPNQMLFRLPKMAMWTKLRPFVREFLEAASGIAELHIYTHGDQAYSAAMGQILDPSRKYFQERILSQADSTQRHVKDLDVMLGAESAVLILDDTVGVWPNHGDNLIQVERYLYFPADAVRFNSPASLLERGKDESPEQGQLSTSLRVIQTLHSRMYPDAGVGGTDVRDHLRQVRAEILRGVSICFTKVIPLGDEPTAHFCWKLAIKLGAQCSIRVSSATTHVVGGSPDTDKAKEARQRKLHTVSVDWLLASAFLWKRLPEEQFPLTRQSQGDKDAHSCVAVPTALDEQQDLEAALSAAGGGRGVDVDEGE